MSEDTIQKFLDNVEGVRLKYVEVTEDAKVPYCDICSEPVHPNSDAQIYATSKLITGHSIDGVRALSLMCRDCKLPMLYFPCVGYFELLINCTIDKEIKIRNPEIRDYSLTDDGIPWEPKEVVEELFKMPYENLLQVSGYTAQGPQDIVNILLSINADPRNVISENGNVTVSETEIEKLSKKGSQLIEKSESKGLPSQPPIVEKLKSWKNSDL